MLSSAQIPNFVSDSTPANQQSVVPNLSIPKKTKRIQRTLLECGYNPRFSLDENKLPAEFTPQVLLDDDFNQLVETTDLPGGTTNPTAEAKKVITPPTAVTPAVNSPIEGVLPGTSKSLSVKKMSLIRLRKFPPGQLLNHKVLEYWDSRSHSSSISSPRRRTEVRHRKLETRRFRLPLLALIPRTLTQELHGKQG